MALLEIGCSIHIVFFAINSKTVPHGSQGLDVGLIVSIETVFIFNLEQDNWPTILRPEGLENWHQGLEIKFDFVEVDCVVGSQLDSVHIQQSSWESSEVPLSTDIRSRPDQDIEIVFFGKLQEEGQIFVASLIVEFSLLHLMVVPHDVDTESVEAHRFDHLQSVFPVLNRDSGVVNLSSHNFRRKCGYSGMRGFCTFSAEFSCCLSGFLCCIVDANSSQGQQSSYNKLALHILLQIMSEFQYSNNRDIQQGSNFLTDFRPSGYLRMLKFPLEYGLLQAALTYGIMYDGFGFHAYYLQRTGAPINSPPWARLKLIGSTFAKYFAIALPFFYFKEVFCSLTYIATQSKPRIRKAIDYAFLQNIFAFAATFPFFYMIEKNVKKSMRGCVILAAFSMLNDMIIETKRKGLLMRGVSYDQIMSKRINENLEFLKETIESVDPMVKHRLASISWDTLKEDVLMNRKKLSDPEELQKEQVDLIASALREEFKHLHKYFD